jgi:DDE superfamily endonuclease/Helix-turn-helix of DDE superfamily endonuclease
LLSINQQFELNISSDTTDQELVNQLSNKIFLLKQENASLRTVQKCSFYESCRNNDRLMKTYTSLVNCRLFEYVYQLLRVYARVDQRSSLSVREQLFLTFVKITNNPSEDDLAFRFGVSQATVSRTFQKGIYLLYNLKCRVIIWPQKEQLKMTMPMVFRKHFGDVISIIDCFEVQIETPHAPTDQAATYSTYKSRNTVKYLISITPQGTISFISKGYVGRNSDQNIVRTSGYLDKVSPGDTVMADKGFRVEEDLMTVGAKLVTPAFLRDKQQLSQLETEQSRRVSNVRIHVERVIGCLRERFAILKGPVDSKFLSRTNEDTSFYDMIVTCCCIIANINPSVVPLD